MGGRGLTLLDLRFLRLDFAQVFRSLALEPFAHPFRNPDGDERPSASVYNVMGKFWRRGGDSNPRYRF